MIITLTLFLTDSVACEQAEVVKFLVRLIGMVLKNPKARNRGENAYGFVLMELGLELITEEDLSGAGVKDKGVEKKIR